MNDSEVDPMEQPSEPKKPSATPEILTIRGHAVEKLRGPGGTFVGRRGRGRTAAEYRRDLTELLDDNNNWQKMNAEMISIALADPYVPVIVRGIPLLDEDGKQVKVLDDKIAAVKVKAYEKIAERLLGKPAQSEEDRMAQQIEAVKIVDQGKAIFEDLEKKQLVQWTQTERPTKPDFPEDQR